MEVGTVVCLVVPQGTYPIEPIARRIGVLHPGWRRVALWCGDPHLRPPLPPGVGWTEADASATWERLLVGREAHRAEWVHATDAAGGLLAAGAERVVLLWVGAVAVLSALDALIRGHGGLAVVPHVLGALPDDGCSPTESDLVAAGQYSTNLLVAHASGTTALSWLHGRFTGVDDLAVGHWLARAVDAFGADIVADPGVGAGPWRWPPVDAVALIEAPGFDVERPWVLDAALELPGRIGVIGRPGREAALYDAAPQLAGERAPLRLPGGIVVDATIRALVADATGKVPAPWTEAPVFRSWLEERYWLALHAGRRDLAAAFPEPVVGDAGSFQAWCRRAFTVDDVPFTVAHRDASTSRVRIDAPLRRGGINLVGYLTRASSLGDVGRRVLAALDAASVPRSTIAYQRTASPTQLGAEPGDQRMSFDTTLAIVNADQFPALAMDHPEVLAASERTIGYWFWELEYIPRQMRDSFRYVHEIWAGSQFVADAFAAVARIPVLHVPIPVPEPSPSDRDRRSFGPLADAGERIVLLVVFDHFSITERKNPVGAIEAFRRAFAPGEGPLLVVKSMNGDGRWPHHQRVLAAAAGRADIVVWDEHLCRADQMALVRSADCLVSLHRSEGLGLHLAEAMWMGVPCIATRYSGNLDFMADDDSLLIDAGRTHVTFGEGVYPETATWADPDLDHAAAAMRRIVSDAGLRARLGEAGRARMAAQPSPVVTGETIARLLRERD